MGMTKADLIGKGLRREQLSVEGLGEVWVREFTLAEVAAGGSDSTRDFADVVCEVLVNGDGTQVLKPEDAPEIRKNLPFRALQQIADKAIELSGLDDKGRGKLEKN